MSLTRAEQLIKDQQDKKWELIQEIKQAHMKGKNDGYNPLLKSEGVNYKYVLIFH